MRVAIVDSGVDTNHVRTPVIKIDLIKTELCQEKNLHGTICALILETYGSVSEFIDVRVLDDDGNGTIEDLICAMDILKGYSVDIINISNGIDRFITESKQYFALFEAINWQLKKGVKIYAAQSNAGYTTIPALFDGVVSVEHASIIRNIKHSIYRKSDIYISGSHHIVLDGHHTISQASNSYACAYATALATAQRISNKNRIIQMGIRLYLHSRSLLQRLYTRYSKKILAFSKLRIPVIVIDGEQMSDFVLSNIHRLYNGFFSSGYRIAIIGNIINGQKAFGYSYANSIQCIKQYIKESRAEIVIYLASKDRYVYKDWDIWISFVEEYITVHSYNGIVIHHISEEDIFLYVSSLMIEEA